MKLTHAREASRGCPWGGGGILCERILKILDVISCIICLFWLHFQFIYLGVIYLPILLVEVCLCACVCMCVCVWGGGGGVHKGCIGPF